MKKYIWKIFLALYLGVLLVHVFETGISWSLAPFLALGFVVALVSHRTSHVISLLFLVAHMTIEAIEYASLGFSFTSVVLFWILVHVAMDYVFLWGEVKKHFYNVRYQMYSSITLGVICIYFFVPRVASAITESHSSILEFIVLGGVMGCVLSHLLPHTHKHEH
ncbi:MAG: hypothetical protein KBC11_00510 [Candidatus Pacebacteria bacterium]|nr:hypothetical protein [Candidatus Paceibacterota bacterium]